MPTLNWLKKEFHYGYDSGNILSIKPDPIREKEEIIIGGSYRDVFFKAIFPYLKPDIKVLELGPGKGSWTRAILTCLTQGELHLVDFQDVAQWLHPEEHQSKVICHQVDDNSFDCLKNDYFDFFFSFGVLCHNNQSQIEEIFNNTLGKMKKGGVAVHQYGDWDKLDKFGWEKGEMPLHFKDEPDDAIWWPRNNQQIMASIAQKTGWEVITSDLGIVKRDSIIVVKRIK